MKRILSRIMLALLLVYMLTLAFNIRLVEADQAPQLLLQTDRNIYLLGENVTITLSNMGNETVGFGGWPPWVIYTHPEWKWVWPGFLAFLMWDLDPGESVTLAWDQSINQTNSFVGPGTYVVYEYNYNYTAFFQIVSLPYGPKAEFTAIPETSNVDESVKFDASKSKAGWNGTHEMPITEYHWDFADGNKTTTSTPIIYHSFSNEGIYYVTSTVHAPGATPETDSATHEVTVTTIPVGGYSLPIRGYTPEKPLTLYLALVAILTTVFTTIERKIHRRTKRP